MVRIKARPNCWFLILLVGGVAEPADAQSSAVTWRGFIRNVYEDQKGIWSSPFRASRQDAKWCLGFGSATGVLIATDKWTSQQLPNTPDQVRVSAIVSRIGASYSVVPAAIGFYAAGVIRKDDRLRETGLLGAEALANGALMYNVVKLSTLRERPTDGTGAGRFWKGTVALGTGGSGFPSGHTTEIWALASVVAHEYPRPRVVPIAAYGLATTVMASRFAARRHFASDVVAGAAIGWFIGDYVYRKHHVPPPHPSRSKLRAILSRVSFGE